MVSNKKNRIVILSIILIVIIITGTFFLMSNNPDGKNGFEVNNIDPEKEKDIASDNFYYVEDFIGEEEWRDGFYRILKYDGKIVKFTGDEKVYLTELKSNEDIYEFPSEDIRANEWDIYENTFGI